MPEMPEIEAARRTVEERALRRTVETVSLRPAGLLVDTSEGTVRSALKDHRLTAARRHGKHLFVRSGEERGRWLRLHFGMTGTVRVYESDEPEPDYTRLRLDLAGGRSLAWTCSRKLGEIGLVESPEAFVQEKGLGPDPTGDGFGLQDFREVLEGRRGTIKGTLMNQEILAGVGNAYSDEALFQAGVHPETSVDELDEEQVGEVWRALTKVLWKTVEYRTDDEARVPGSWLLPHREDGADCPRCGGTIRKARVSGRSSYFCDRHQEGG